MRELRKLLILMLCVASVVMTGCCNKKDARETAKKLVDDVKESMPKM